MKVSSFCREAASFNKSPQFARCARRTPGKPGAAGLGVSFRERFL